MNYKIEDKDNINSFSMKGFERFIIIIAVFIIAALASCVRDLGGEKGVTGDGNALVTLSLTMPASPVSRTTTPGTLDENKVNEVDVILFMNDKFYYRAPGTTPVKEASAGDAEEKKEFTVKLPLTPSGEKYRLVVVANARAGIGTFTPSLPVSTIVDNSPTSYNNVVDGLERTVAWKMATNGFPMW